MSNDNLLTAEILRGLLAKKAMRSMSTERCYLTGRFPDIPGLENFERFTEEAAEMLGCLGDPPESMSHNYPGLRELSRAVAARLLFDYADHIELGGFESVPTELLGFLSSCCETLELNGVKELPLEHAECIRDSGVWSLILNGLKDLPAPVARVLSQKRHGFILILNGIECLSDEACDYLGQINGRLHISSVRELSDAAIRSLCKKKQGTLDLSGLKILSDVGAKTLSDYKDVLYLDGLEELPDPIARAFGNRNGHLSLNGLRTISPKSAEALASHVGTLELNGIETICPEAARALRQHRGRIEFNGLKSIPDDTAFELARYDDNDLQLHGLTRIPEPFLKCNASWLDCVHGFDDQEEIDEDVAQKLVEISSDTFSTSLRGLKSISVPVARRLAKCTGKLVLSGLETLPVDVARALSGHQETLSLSGPTRKSEEAAWGLSGHQGKDRLDPEGQASLSPQVEAALTHRDQDLSFGRLVYLSDESAKELSMHRGGSLSFEGVRRISDQGMESLSKYRGNLWISELDAFSEAAQNSMAEFRGTLKSIPMPERFTSVAFADRCLRHGFAFPNTVFDSSDYDWSGLIIQSRIISDEIVKMIVDRLPPQGYRALHLGVAELSHQAATLWSSYPTNILEFGRLESLPPESAGSLAKFAGDLLIFDVLDVGSPQVLKALMTYRGKLELKRFFELDAERAEVLSTFEGEALALPNLWTMTDEASETISKSRIRSLSTPLLDELSTNAICALACFEGELEVPDRIKSRIDPYR